MAQPHWPAPCLPPDDDPRCLDALSGLGVLDGLGDGRDVGLGQHGGHQVDLVVPAAALPVGSPRQCCLDVNLIDWERVQHWLQAESSSRNRCGSRGSRRLSGEGG